MSQILLILLDSRCPLIHFPTSLQRYLATINAKLILVLTKVDISGPERSEAWASYLRQKYPDVQVVMVEAYIPKMTVADLDDAGGTSSSAATGKRRRYDPHIPQTFKEKLVNALQNAHQQLLEPPEKVKQDPEKLQRWRPRVKRDVNWDAVLTAGVSSHHHHTPRDAKAASKESGDVDSEHPEEEPEYLTVGLIGMTKHHLGVFLLLTIPYRTAQRR